MLLILLVIEKGRMDDVKLPEKNYEIRQKVIRMVVSDIVEHEKLEMT